MAFSNKGFRPKNVQNYGFSGKGSRGTLTQRCTEGTQSFWITVVDFLCGLTKPSLGQIFFPGGRPVVLGLNQATAVMNCLLTVLFVALLLGAKAQHADTAFALCADAPNYPYYHPKLRYEGNFWAIKKHFYEGFQADEFVALPNNTGLVTVHFWVNCRGISGDFQTACYSFDYKPILVDKRITDRLVVLTAGLHGWIPAEFEKSGQVVNSHKFFTFRLEHGKLVDILPQ